MFSARLWEWVVDYGAARAPSGVSGTRDRAMDALSRTLIAAGTPASGRVVPVTLVDGALGVFYRRSAPALRADCEDGVITWSLSTLTATGGNPRQTARPRLTSPCRPRPGCTTTTSAAASSKHTQVGQTQCRLVRHATLAAGVNSR